MTTDFAPSSHAAGSELPATRRPLQLSARSATDASSTPSASTEGSAAAAPSSRSNPFGAARPIDTAAKEREVDEKLAKARAEQAAALEARNRERDEKRKQQQEAGAAAGPTSPEAAGKADGAWVRRGPLPPSQQQPKPHRQHSNPKSSSDKAPSPSTTTTSSTLPPAVPTVAAESTPVSPPLATGGKIERPAHRKEGFSYSKAAGKPENEGGDAEVEQVTEGVEQTKLE